MSLLGLALTVFASMMTALANIFLRQGLAQSLESTGGIWRIASLAGNLAFVAGVMLYGLAMLAWLKVLSMEPVSSAYPVLVGLTFILLFIGATLFANEPISLNKVAGTMLILLGIAITVRS